MSHGMVLCMTRPTIFEFAGGEPAFLALASAHHERFLQDPVLNHPFSRQGHPQHIERLAAYWAEVFGGPPKFSEECGGQSAMISLHAGNGISDDLGMRFVRCFVQSIEEAGLPDNAEFRAVLREYMEWAVEDVIKYSPKGSTVPESLTVPRWSWDGLEQPSPQG